MSTEIVVDEATFDKLASIELRFEESENAIIRKQVELQSALFKERHEIVSKINNFWALVFEQAPPDIDEYIQPTDATALLASLTSFEVNHFEIEGGDSGLAEPRSIAFKFGFKENEYFTDTVIEKKFRFRYGKGDWSGFVSEPVKIHWKDGKDLTNGLLDCACKVYEDDQIRIKNNLPKDDRHPTENEKELIKKLEGSIEGAVSFFAWFGYRGRDVTDEEHVQAKSDVAKRLAGEEVKRPEPQNEEEEEEEDDDDEHDFEIFTGGADLAICLADDLYPNAIKYFTQAHEMENMSDVDFDTEDEEMAEN